MNSYEVSNGLFTSFVAAGTTSPAGLKSTDVEPIRPGEPANHADRKG
jgi:hypothetical protein